jgi:hypothetical protein
VAVCYGMALSLYLEAAYEDVFSIDGSNFEIEM